ncbi:MAG: DNA polymerase III subunit delta [Mangrovicoccus sp.]
MKLSSRDLLGFLAKPDAQAACILFYSTEPMLVADRRKAVVLALTGPEADHEMRLTRLSAAEIRKSPAALIDAAKGQSFYPGPRAVIVEDAGDGIAPALTAALEEWQPGDAVMVLGAGQLNARSKLRKLVENDPRSYAAGLYPDPPGRAEIEAGLAAAGLSPPSGDAMAALQELGGSLELGEFKQLIIKLGLFKQGDDSPLSVAEIDAMAPASLEAGIDDLIHACAEARTGDIGPLMRRLSDQGTSPVSLVIAANRHFQTLHRLASAPDGPGSAIGKLRPPLFGPRRDRLLRQAKAWRMVKLEEALTALTEADLSLRTSPAAPPMALLERALIRISVMGRA